ncbi:hypothetical protein PAMA_019881 [Pampus argenteus]
MKDVVSQSSITQKTETNKPPPQQVAQESPAEDHQAGHWPGGRLHQLCMQISCMLSDTPGGAHAPSEPANTSDLISTVGPCSASEAERKWQGIGATEACLQYHNRLSSCDSSRQLFVLDATVQITAAGNTDGDVCLCVCVHEKFECLIISILVKHPPHRLGEALEPFDSDFKLQEPICSSSRRSLLDRRGSSRTQSGQQQLRTAIYNKKVLTALMELSIHPEVNPPYKPESVSVGLLHGRATYIIWPPNRWQQIKPSLPPNRGPLDTDEE